MSLFRTVALNAAGALKVEIVRDLFDEFLEQLELQCGVDGREMAIVRTKLQEASFFAVRAVAVDLVNQG